MAAVDFVGEVADRPLQEEPTQGDAGHQDHDVPLIEADAFAEQGSDRRERRQYQSVQQAGQHAYRRGTKRLEDFERDAMGENRSEEHTSELQSLAYLVCRLLLE